MAVFPESLNRLNLNDTQESLSKIEEYIRYMGERIEFSFRNMTKTISASGISSTEMYILIQAQGQTLAALQSTLNGLAGNITSMQGTISALDARVTALENLN